MQIRFRQSVDDPILSLSKGVPIERTDEGQTCEVGKLRFRSESLHDYIIYQRIKL